MTLLQSEKKPLLIYDGECHFCCRWIERWRTYTEDQIDYEPFQKVAIQFPEISEQSLKGSVHLVEANRKHTRAAEAVFRLLSYVPSKKWMLALYEKVGIFRIMSEAFYRLVASNRTFFSMLSRFFWGRNLQPSNYAFSVWLFLKGISLVYLAAFASLAVQIVGLVGSDGIIPAQDYLAQISAKFGAEKFFLIPTLAWFSASDTFLRGLCWGGVLISLFAFLGILPRLMFTLLWVGYLSLFVIGQSFLSFQWDILLLEVGFLTLFLSPPVMIMKRKGPLVAGGFVLWLFHWLVFRLMFLSGWVKISNEDRSWNEFLALNYHYETQPLPTWIGWYAHQLPEYFQKLSVITTLGIELFLPFLVFFPRRIRHFTAVVFIAFQTLIILTGNYGFFNWLSILICLLLLDNSFWPQKLATGLLERLQPVKQTARHFTIVVGALVIMTSLVNMSGSLRWKVAWPQPVIGVYSFFRPFRITSNYGLFATMTKRRLEIEVEGSNNGKSWRPYEFKYKPGNVDKAPGFIAPHQPRLDWQMWFAALGNVQQNQWFVQFCVKLLQGSPEVTNLLKENPFPEDPPRFVRAAMYDYHFTNAKEKAQTGNWWRRERKGLYMRTLATQS